MYNVMLVDQNKIVFNYVFSKKSKAKAEELFKMTLLERDSRANVRGALDDGVADYSHPDHYGWHLYISELEKSK